MGTIPDITLPSLASGVPSGYVLGRIDPGTGAAQLIPLDLLAAQLVGTGGVAGGPTVTPTQGYLGFSIAGPMGPNSQWKGAVSADNITYPSAHAASFAQCDTPPSATFTVYFVTNLTSFIGGGYPNGVAATITFTNGSNTGTFNWLTTALFTAETIPYLVWPNDFDAVLAGVEVLIFGDLL